MKQRIFHIMRIANGYAVILPNDPDATQDQYNIPGLTMFTDKNTHAFDTLEKAIAFLSFKLKEENND